jgi:hypothetical protein
MPRKRYSPEQIVAKLRPADVELSEGHTTVQVCKKLSIAEQTPDISIRKEAQRETTEPAAAAASGRACAEGAARVRAAGVPGAGVSAIDAPTPGLDRK